MLTILALLAAAQPAVPPTQAANPPARPAPDIPTRREADFRIRDFKFRSGETLPELRIHYTTLGTPHRNAAGEIDNAVMVLHGTGGSGYQFLSPQFAGPLYGPGQPLNLGKYWVILPDNIGHGKSSKPSDGLRMAFPHYDYDDMVAAQYRLLTAPASQGGLGIRRMRLIMGTSMGCMHAFVWGATHPDFARALMPLACEPIAIAGLNRMWRQLVVDGIKADPAWADGNYTAQPAQGLRTAQSLLFVAGAAPLNLQATYPTRDAAATYAQERVSAGMKTLDANDLIYQIEASRTYDPWPTLETITAPVAWLNSADDFINPRNLDVPQRAVARMKNATFRMIPETTETRGHGTHTWAVNWSADLAALLKRTE